MSEMKQNQVREPIATWYKIGQYDAPSIDPVQVVAFTKSYVTFLYDPWGAKENEVVKRRERRDDIFPSFAEAKAEFLSRCEKRVTAAKDELQRARTKLGQVQSLEEAQ